MPYLLRKHGVPVNQIANVVAIALLPETLSFLWSPIADTGLRRRSWIALSSVVAAIAAAAAVIDVGGSMARLTVLLFLTDASVGLVSASCGALMTSLPSAIHGRAGAWYNSGFILAGAIGGGATIWLADRVSLPVLGITVAIAIGLPALAAFRVEEPLPVKQAIIPQMTGMFQDLRQLFTARRTWLGLIFFVSPTGSGALANLVSSVGPDYHASGSQVAWIAGVGSGLFGTLGCFLGGWVADRMNRMLAYALTGGLVTFCGVFLAVGHRTASTYSAGCFAYAIATGIAWAIFTALVIDIVGPRKRAPATAYATLDAFGSLPLSYMTWLDGVGYKRWGARGMMATDAVANGISAVLLLAIVAVAGRSLGHKHQTSAVT